MVAAEPTLRLAAVRTVVAALTPRLPVADEATHHLRVAAGLIPPPAAADVAILHRVAGAEAVALVAAVVAEAIVPAAVVATAADIDKLTL